ncbi:unnamed protein product, partial [Amoebophrya sp. A120]|eukprot:GSA120T00019482001.1
MFPDAWGGTLLPGGVLSSNDGSEETFYELQLISAKNFLDSDVKPPAFFVDPNPKWKWDDRGREDVAGSTVGEGGDDVLQYVYLLEEREENQNQFTESTSSHQTKDTNKPETIYIPVGKKTSDVCFALPSTFPAAGAGAGRFVVSDQNKHDGNIKQTLEMSFSETVTPTTGTSRSVTIPLSELDTVVSFYDEASPGFCCWVAPKIKCYHSLEETSGAVREEIVVRETGTNIYDAIELARENPEEQPRVMISLKTVRRGRQEVRRMRRTAEAVEMGIAGEGSRNTTRVNCVPERGRVLGKSSAGMKYDEKSCSSTEEQSGDNVLDPVAVPRTEHQQKALMVYYPEGTASSSKNPDADLDSEEPDQLSLSALRRMMEGDLFPARPDEEASSSPQEFVARPSAAERVTFVTGDERLEYRAEPELSIYENERTTRINMPGGGSARTVNT